MTVDNIDKGIEFAEGVSLIRCPIVKGAKHHNYPTVKLYGITLTGKRKWSIDGRVVWRAAF